MAAQSASPAFVGHTSRSVERWTLVLFLAFFAACAACSRHDAPGMALQVGMRVRPDPPVVGVAALELELRDATGASIHGATVTIEGNMSHPGMPPSLAEAKETTPGIYRADLDLTMAGDWIVQVDAHLADGRTGRRTLRLPAVRVR